MRLARPALWRSGGGGSGDGGRQERPACDCAPKGSAFCSALSARVAELVSYQPTEARLRAGWAQGERATRRDPRVHTGIACVNMKQEGKCALGDACPCAHSAWGECAARACALGLPCAAAPLTPALQLGTLLRGWGADFMSARTLRRVLAAPHPLPHKHLLPGHRLPAQVSTSPAAGLALARRVGRDGFNGGPACWGGQHEALPGTLLPLQYNKRRQALPQPHPPPPLPLPGTASSRTTPRSSG